MTEADVTTFIRRLDKVMASRSRNKPNSGAATPAKTPTNIPTIEVLESNGAGSPGGPKKLTYV